MKKFSTRISAFILAALLAFPLISASAAETANDNAAAASTSSTSVSSSSENINSAPAGSAEGQNASENDSVPAVSGTSEDTDKKDAPDSEVSDEEDPDKTSGDEKEKAAEIVEASGLYIGGESVDENGTYSGLEVTIEEGRINIAFSDNDISAVSTASHNDAFICYEGSDTLYVNISGKNTLKGSAGCLYALSSTGEGKVVISGKGSIEISDFDKAAVCCANDLTIDGAETKVPEITISVKEDKAAALIAKTLTIKNGKLSAESAKGPAIVLNPEKKEAVTALTMEAGTALKAKSSDAYCAVSGYSDNDAAIDDSLIYYAPENGEYKSADSDGKKIFAIVEDSSDEIKADADTGFITGGASEVEIGEKIPLSGITVTPESVTLKIGKTAQLTAAVDPENAYDTSVTWSSDNAGIASVDADGKVTAVKAGSTTVTAVSDSDGKISAKCKVTVLPLPSVTIDKTEAYVGKGGSLTLSAAVANASAAPVSEETAAVSGNQLSSKVIMVGSSVSPTFSSSSENAITSAVSANDSIATAKIAGVGTVGSKYTTTITITGVNTGSTTVGLYKNDKLLGYIAVTVNAKVTWSSSDPKVASVDNNGVVTGVYEYSSADEVLKTATITATYTEDGRNYTASSLIKVININLDKTTASVAKGATTTLTAAVWPASASPDIALEWESGSATVATVKQTDSSSDRKATVSGLTAGTAKITVSASDEAVGSASATVTVTASTVTTTSGASSTSTSTAKTGDAAMPVYIYIIIVIAAAVILILAIRKFRSKK